MNEFFYFFFVSGSTREIYKGQKTEMYRNIWSNVNWQWILSKRLSTLFLFCRFFVFERKDMMSYNIVFFCIYVFFIVCFLLPAQRWMLLQCISKCAPVCKKNSIFSSSCRWWRWWWWCWCWWYLWEIEHLLPLSSYEFNFQWNCIVLCVCHYMKRVPLGSFRSTF